LEKTPSGEDRLTIQSPLSVGLFAGKWCSYAAPPDLPHDQREEDGGALIFETPPLGGTLEIMGAPVLNLVFSSSEPVAMVAVRLSDVAPDDKTTRVTYGLLNLCHRDSHEAPTALEPGRTYRVQIPLNHIAQSFPADNRLRLSLSTSYWPLAWPPPRPVRLTVHTGTSHLELPVRRPRQTDQKLRSFEEPVGAPPVLTRQLEPGNHQWRVVRDLAEEVSSLEVVIDNGTICFEEIGWTVTNRAREWYTFEKDHFTSVRGETQWTRRFRRGSWDVKVVTRTTLTSSETHFRLHAEMDAWEKEERVFARNWQYDIPRSYV
jgi:hypothetical protein